MIHRRRPPADPRTAGLVRAARSTTFDRRALLRTTGLGGVAAALAACAPPTPPAGNATALQLPTDVSDTENIVRWANWTAYLDYDDEAKNYPTLEAFMDESGIEVEYAEDIEDNDAYFNKIAPQLRAKQDIGKDIFTFTDWMANRVIRDQLCQPLDLIRMPNAANLLDSLKDVSFDPGRHNSLTWQSGFAGIGYDKSKVGGDLKSLDDLWKPELRGRVVVLSEFRDTAALVMQQQGVDLSKGVSAEQFDAAVAEVDKRVSDGNIRRIRGNSYLEDLKSGNAVAGIVWSGDLFILRAETENDNWEFVIPESGGTLWSDNMMIPITSTHRRNAMELMDYYYDPAVAAEVAAWVNYVCPVQGAQEEMEKIDPDLASSPFIFPTEEYLRENNIQLFPALSAQDDQAFSQIWARVVGN